MRDIIDKQKKGISKDSMKLKRSFKDKERELIRIKGLIAEYSGNITILSDKLGKLVAQKVKVD